MQVAMITASAALAVNFPVREADLFLGNAGTAFRPLTAVLALMGGEYRLHGVPRMHERPIGDLVDALRQIGACIDYEGTPVSRPCASIRRSSATHPSCVCAEMYRASF
jgi:5-enolpyruvylshikimate-3-phosphate synthase